MENNNNKKQDVEGERSAVATGCGAVTPSTPGAKAPPKVKQVSRRSNPRNSTRLPCSCLEKEGPRERRRKT